MEKQPSLESKMAIIEELVRGRELANQLLQLVRHESNKGGKEFLLRIRSFAEDLVNKILRSFTNTLLLCNTNRHNDSLGISFADSSSSSAWNISEESKDQNLDVSCRSFRKRTRRGCYKRNASMQTWEKDSPALIDDGYAWRKYGQKMTTNAKFMRNYYRCSHKEEQGCAAMKQVQRIQEKPPLYRTIYIGLHTCKNQMLPEMTLDPTSASDSSILLSFNNTSSALPSEQDHHHSFFSSSSTKKDQHDQDEIIPIDQVDVEQNLQVSQYEPVTVLSSNLDPFSSSVKLESCYDDMLFMRCFDFDDFACFGQ